MNNSNSPSNPLSPRTILTLKPGVRRVLREIKKPCTPRPNSKSHRQPAANWSDENKERMQADMDALLR